MKDDTICQALPEDGPEGFDSLVVPVYRASTIVFPTVEAYQRRREALYDGYSYGLYGTPTSRALEQQLAQLEGAERSLVLPSGLAAIALVTLANVRSGERVLFPDNVYDTVRPVAQNLFSSAGIHAEFYDPAVGAGLAARIGDDVKLVWVESPGSMTLEVQDVPAIVAAAHARGARVAADNTWASPLRFKPLAHGVDFSVLSASKYIAGHSDVVMGVVSVSDLELYRRLKDFSRYLGYGVSPDDCSLVLRSIATLAVRLDRCEASALDLARWLTGFRSVREVRHPALPTNPGHELWQRDFSGASGVFSVFLDARTRPVLAVAVESLKLFSIGASWGGTHSVAAPLAQAPRRDHDRHPHDGPILRLSIGLENVEDLRDDLRRAMQILDQTITAPAAAAGRGN